MSDERIIFRYILGTVVEISALCIAAASAILGAVYAVGSGLAWLCDHMPDWMILPMFLLIIGISFFMTFGNVAAPDEKRSIRGYRCTLYKEMQTYVA